MNDEEKKVLKSVLDEMKTARAMTALWLRGTPVDATLADWIKKLEGLLK